MNVKLVTTGIMLLALCGCSVGNAIAPDVKVSYQGYTSGDVSSGSVPFTLESSAVTLDSNSGAAPGGGGSSHAIVCKGGDDDWTSCLAGVSAQSAIIAPDQTLFDPKAVGYNTIFLATPNNDFWNDLTTSYAMTSTPIANNELLAKQIAIANTDNLASIITDAGTGAAAGIPFGPIAAGVGGFVGGLSAIAGENSLYQYSALPPNDFSTMICTSQSSNGKPYDFSKLPSVKPAPVLPLPIVIVPGPSSQFVPSDTSDSSPVACWHPIPNNLRSEVAYGTIANPADPVPVEGDGWFYRIIDSKPVPGNSYFDSTDPETGLQPTTTANPTAAGVAALDKATGGTEFPVSSCHKVTIQIAWWKSLANAFAGTGSPVESVYYTLDIADPGYLNYVTIPKSGSINFRLICGAYVSDTYSGPPTGAILTATTAQVSAYLKAMPSASSKPTTTKQ